MSNLGGMYRIGRGESRVNFIPVNRYGPLKNVSKNQKVKLLTLACLFLKKKFNETHKDFSINYSYSNKYGRQFSVFNSSSNWTTKYFGAKLIRPLVFFLSLFLLNTKSLIFAIGFFEKPL